MTRHPRPLAEPTAHLLAALTRWRSELAAELARCNPLCHAQAHHAAQRILDRLVFARFAESQGVPPPRTLAGAVQAWERDPSRRPLYACLIELFRLLAEPWGGGLFAAHPLADAAQLADSRVLFAVVGDLERTAEQCRFSALPIEFLGGVYEQLLGRAVLLSGGDSNNRSGSDDGDGGNNGNGSAVQPARPGPARRPRHAGGVYYTPRYVVDAVIERTLAPLLEGATPAAALHLRVLDPACGAGSFLLAASAYLADWHLRYYGQEKEPARRFRHAVYQDLDGALRLRACKRAQILRRCIHGRDLDPHAVELARLSLLLQLRTEQVREARTGSGRRPRTGGPELAANFRCGDTLLPDPDDERSAAAAFSAIIGNPPYIRTQALSAAMPGAAQQYRQRYVTAQAGSCDIYVVFIERGLQLLRAGGRLGFIIPSRWWQAAYGAPLRQLLGQGRHYAEIHDFADEQVFAEPTTYTCISVFTKAPTQTILYRRTSPSALRRHGVAGAAPLWEHRLASAQLGTAPFYPGVRAPLRPLFDRLLAQGPFLSDPAICPRIFQGLKTGLDSVFVLEERPQAGCGRYWSPALEEQVELEPALLHPLVKGRQMQRFALLPPRRVILFPYAVQDGAATLIPPPRLAREFPAAWHYLQRNRPALLAREHGQCSGPDFYKYTRSQALELVGAPKLLTADLARWMAFSHDRAGRLYLLGGAAGGYGLLPAQPELAGLLLAVLNSSLLEWLLRPPGLSAPFRGGWFSCESRFISRLPIRFPQPAAAADRTALLALAERLSESYAQLHAAAPELRAAMLPPAAGPIAAIEAELDDRVFALYGVTTDERRAVLAAVAQARRCAAAPDGLAPAAPDSPQ